MKAVVVAGGDASEHDRVQLAGAELIVAADSGARWLTDAGTLPHLLVGDLDSCDPAFVAELETRGVRVERHPSAKEASDTELAVVRALSEGADDIVVLGALGGERLDHELSNALLLADPAWRGHRLRLVRNGTTVQVIRAGERLTLEGRPGDLVTLLPVAGRAEGIVTSGLAYPLRDEPLEVGRSRGLSNVVVADGAQVSVRSGTLLVVETSEGRKEEPI